MKLLAVDDYIRFECIGGDCPISCCGGNWGIMIDEDSMKYYQGVGGEFGDRLRAGITIMNGRPAFAFNDNKDCIFLNENKLCEIYRNIGPDALCDTCRNYPRMLYEVGDILFCFLTNSCPEVNRMLMTREDPIQILFDDSDTENEEIRDYDKKRFERALKVYNSGVHLLQNRKIALKDRLALLLMFVSRYQDLEREGLDPSGIIEVFGNEDMYIKLIGSIPVSRRDYAGKIHAFMIIFKALLSDAYDHPMWDRLKKLAGKVTDNGINDIDALENAFDRTDSEEIQIELEQIMVYRFFAVFMQGFENVDHYEKLVYEYIIYAALLTYIALEEMGNEEGCSMEDRILYYSVCSRIEHSDKQKKGLIDMMTKDGLYELGEVFRLIS